MEWTSGYADSTFWWMALKRGMLVFKTAIVWILYGVAGYFLLLAVMMVGAFGMIIGDAVGLGGPLPELLGVISILVTLTMYGAFRIVQKKGKSSKNNQAAPESA